jgi:hypothetical protein
MADINKLIKALRASADKVENGTSNYFWANPASCNCGILAQQVAGSDVLRVDRNNGLEGTWTGMVRRNACSLTGTPISQIIARLKEVGFKRSDFQELEHLANIKICKRAKIDRSPHYFTFQVNFVKYVRAWADILEEQEAAKSAKKSNIIKAVNKLVAKPIPKFKTLTQEVSNHANRRKSRSKVIRTVN